MTKFIQLQLEHVKSKRRIYLWYEVR